ncbi:hypothetical protein E4P42_05960 [Mycobacterium sp. PS03-16]|uniref:hypothetical protein n=1 Tax=Mycobacterium sp. PS03-16 TaxID=2559611 RepID=UPI0010738E15|nr:hypothetical protein [Mycobacterium sp. PS03-16]TFV59919.1 hypothetical protein E4P42_05960 [Mycobacterium sp. PS03-16]
MRPLGQVERSVAEEIATACVDHLFSQLKSRGKFVYAHQYQQPSVVHGGYNLLRHCGTVWFMCRAIRSLDIHLTARQERRLGAAVGYIRGKTATPSWIPQTTPALCITSRGVVKLGGVALATLMFREFGRLHQVDGEALAAHFPDGVEQHCIQLDNYIVSQLRGDDFVHKRVLSTGEVLPFRSEYYTGEAMLALMQSTRQVLGVRIALGKLLDRGYGLTEQSHWMAYTACAALRSGYSNESKVALYLERLIESIASDPSYRERRESTPIACRTEALVEILRTYQQDNYLNAHLPRSAADTAEAIAAENLALQMKYYGEGQFRKGDGSDKVQIDYIQHNAASFLGWFELGH